MKIGYLGAGAWGFCLANLLAENGHEVILWMRNEKVAGELAAGGFHPKLREFKLAKGIRVTTDLKEAVSNRDVIVESVTTNGFRSILQQIRSLVEKPIPLVMTSKGIEQGTGLLMSEIAEEVLGASWHDKLCCLSGPSLAAEVAAKLPTSIVSASYDEKLRYQIAELFTTNYFRVYPNSDMKGVSFGGAMKNIFAIACGLSDALELGYNAKAALMTRGLHEIKKLSKVKGCHPDTLNGLSGMGDLCVTCLSILSRNYRFGTLLAKGLTPDEAKQEIGMVVEGSFTCVSALELSKKSGIPLPITQVIYSIIYEGLNPRDAVIALLTRKVKEEHL